MNGANPAIMTARELVIAYAEMAALTPCADCPSEPALVLDGDQQGDVVLTHKVTCPAVQARRPRT